MSSTTLPAAAGADRLKDEPLATPDADGLGHDCLVCGKPSTTRCSSCFAKSGFSLYFCSTGHQKLAWPFHKLVCGKRAHPFRLPPFTQEEADIAYKRLTEPLRRDENRELREVMTTCLDALLKDPARLQPYLDELVDHEGELAQPPNYLCKVRHSDDAKEVVTMLRCFGSQWDRSTLQKTGNAGLMEEFLQVYLGLKADHVLDTESYWHSMLCHTIGSEVAIWLDAYLGRSNRPDDFSKRRAVPLRIAQLRLDNLTRRLRLLQSSALPPSASKFRSTAVEKTLTTLTEATAVWGTVRKFVLSR